MQPHWWSHSILWILPRARRLLLNFEYNLSHANDSSQRIRFWFPWLFHHSRLLLPTIDVAAAAAAIHQFVCCCAHARYGFWLICAGEHSRSGDEKIKRTKNTHANEWTKIHSHSHVDDDADARFTCKLTLFWFYYNFFFILSFDFIWIEWTVVSLKHYSISLFHCIHSTHARRCSMRMLDTCLLWISKREERRHIKWLAISEWCT